MFKVLSSLALVAALIFFGSVQYTIAQIDYTQQKKSKKKPPVVQGPKETIKPEIDPNFCLSREKYFAFAHEIGARPVFGGSTSYGDRIIVQLMGEDGMLITRKDAEDKFCLVYILHGITINHDMIINLHKSGQSKV